MSVVVEISSDMLTWSQERVDTSNEHAFDYLGIFRDGRDWDDSKQMLDTSFVVDLCPQPACEAAPPDALRLATDYFSHALDELLVWSDAEAWDDSKQQLDVPVISVSMGETPLGRVYNTLFVTADQVPFGLADNTLFGLAL